MEDKTAEIPSLKGFSAKDKLKKQSNKKPERTRIGSNHGKNAQKGGDMDSTRQFSYEETVRVAQGSKRAGAHTQKNTGAKDDLGSTRVFDTPLVKKNVRKPDSKLGQQTADRKPADGRRHPKDAVRKKSPDTKHREVPEKSLRRGDMPKDRHEGAQRRGADASSAPARKKSAPAPKSYARDRMKSNEQAKHSRVRQNDFSYNEAGAYRDGESYHHHRTSPHAHPNEYAHHSHGSAETREFRRGERHTPAVPQTPKKSKKPKKPLTPAARKFRNVLVYLAIMLVVLIVGAVLSLTVLFKTEVINVSGNGQYPVQEIIEVSGLSKGENIFTAPKSWAEKKLENRYPYIEDANIYAVFPNTINIDITMAKPACVVEDSGSYYIVSSKSKVMEVVATTDEIDAPVIEGVSIKGAAAGEYIEYESDIVRNTLEEIFAAFAEYGCTKITAINVASGDDGTLEVKYVYDDRIVVFLGIPEYLNYKIQTAHTIITEKIDVDNASLAGELDVSMCYESKKSYFNQYTILAPNQAPTTDPSAPTDETLSAEGEGEYVQDDYGSEDYYADGGESDYYADDGDYYADDGAGDYYADDGSGDYYAE